MVKYRVTYEIEVESPGDEDYAWDALNDEAWNNPDIKNINFITQEEVPVESP